MKIRLGYRGWVVVLAAWAATACGGDTDDEETCGLFDPNGITCATMLSGGGSHPCDATVESACGPVGANPTCEAPAMQDCATNYYLRGYSPDTLRACDPSYPILPIDKDLELSLFRGEGMTDQDTVGEVQGLQRYYEPHQLRMFTRDVAKSDPIRYAMQATMAELNQALIDAGISPSAPSLTEEEEALAVQAIGRALFAPTREFLSRYAEPAEPKVNVAVIHQILSPDVVELMEMEGTVVGLGLSPTVIERASLEDPDAQSLYTFLEVDQEFTPTLFVGHTDIQRLAGDFDVIIAHEMGHCLGLVHVELDGNLMEPTTDEICRPWLSQEQIDVMGPFAAQLSRPEETLLKLLRGQRTLLRRVLQMRGGSSN